MMFKGIKSCKIPEESLLNKYDVDNNYTDCFVISIPSNQTLADYIYSFYTTKPFKLERFLLSFIVNKRSSDIQVLNLANNKIKKFSAWYEEHRTDNQLLMSDFRNKTRSWFMIKPNHRKGEVGSLLYFGSAVVKGKTSTAKTTFNLLLAFHVIYSKVLLLTASKNFNHQEKVK